MKLIEKLTSGNPDSVIKAILMLRDTLPTSPCIKVLGMLLISADKEVEQCTSKFFNGTCYYLLFLIPVWKKCFHISCDKCPPPLPHPLTLFNENMLALDNKNLSYCPNFVSKMPFIRLVNCIVPRAFARKIQY